MTYLVNDLNDESKKIRKKAPKNKRSFLLSKHDTGRVTHSIQKRRGDNTGPRKRMKHVARTQSMHAIQLPHADPSIGDENDRLNPSEVVGKSVVHREPAWYREAGIDVSDFTSFDGQRRHFAPQLCVSPKLNLVAPMNHEVLLRCYPGDLTPFRLATEQSGSVDKIMAFQEEIKEKDPEFYKVTSPEGEKIFARNFTSKEKLNFDHPKPRNITLNSLKKQHNLTAKFSSKLCNDYYSFGQ